MELKVRPLAPAVEIFSATDPVYITPRSVWYWIEVAGEMKSAKSESYAEIKAQAEALETQLGNGIIDRSDKDSGYLRSTLA